MPATPSPLRYRPDALAEVAQRLLEALDLPRERARDVAEVLLEGDLLGHTTHGLALLTPYLRELEQGGMAKHGELEVVADNGAALTWDGHYLPGPWLVRRAVDTARQRVTSHSVAVVALRRSHHIACLEAYLKPATDAGLFMLLTCSDPSMASVAPAGGVASVLTPNPIAAGWPTKGDPVWIDISTSTTTNGLTRRVFDAGERLPGPWVVGSDGRPTDDPAVLFSDRPGAILPLGGIHLGHKGFGLGLLVEALTSALTGSGRAEPPGRWGASVFLMLLDPAAFGGHDAFLRETTHIAEACHASPALPGRPPVRMPGEGALAHRARQLAQGVELHPSILPALAPWAEKLGVPLPAALSAGSC